MSRASSRSIFAVMAAVLLAIACSESPTSTPEVGELLAAKGGNGGGGGGGDKGPTVRSVDPDSGFQGTNIVIEVSGSGYDEESEVSFELENGEVPKIIVTSTKFISSRKLIADITIDEEAETGFYNVAVTTKGRKGVGTESFKVKAEAIAVDATFRDDAPDGLISDDGTSYDATAHDWFNVDAREKVTPRRLCLDFHGQLKNDQVGFSDTDETETKLCDDGFINTATHKYADPEYPEIGEHDPDDTWMSQMPINSVQRPIWLALYHGREGFDWTVWYGKGCGQIFFPDEAPIVTRTSETTWTIEATTAWVCKGTVKGKPRPPEAVGGASVNMPVFIKAVRQQ